MKKKIITGLIFGVVTIMVSSSYATTYDFETEYNGTSFTLASTNDPLTTMLQGGDNFTYTIDTLGSDYFEVISSAGWNPWLFIGITDGIGEVTFDYKTELYLGTSSVLEIPWTTLGHSTNPQGTNKFLGIIDFSPHIPLGTMFDQVVLSADIFTSVDNFSFKTYEPSELLRSDLNQYVSATAPPNPGPDPGPGPGPAPVPEPATMLLFSTGLVGLLGTRIRRKKK